MSRHIIVLGMPGAGKDTQCDLLASKLKASVIKTGDIARSLAKTNTDVAQILKNGGLVSDELINAELKKILHNASSQSDIIYDGFPRRVAQAQWLDEVLSEKESLQLSVFFLRNSHATAQQRLMNRGRADDTREVIENRLNVFMQETEPVLGYYRSSGRLVEIDGEPSVDSIHEQILKELGQA